MTKKSLTFDECKQLSSRIIAMNPNRRANMGQISSHLLDYYTELTKQTWLAQLVGQIRDLTAQQNQMMQEEMKAGETYQQLDRKITDLKKQLPFRSPHYFHFLEDHRAQKFIDPEAFTFQTTVDIDNPEEVEPAVKNALLLNGMFDEPTEKLFREKIFSAEDIELWKGKVLHIERSARNKAHIDIRIPVGMTIAEAQSAFCKLIHATEDPSCVTPERIIFITDAAMMNLLIAAMSSGKSLVNGPIDCIIEDLVQMDKVNRQKEQDWKDEVNTMGDNKKKPVRPEDICIRIVSPDLTRAAYIQRLDDVQKAGDAYLYCKMDEVDMLRKFNDPSQLIRLCWDNSEDGQERVGTKSVTARVKTRFNWNASSTIAVTQKFFSVREVADGAVSRLSLATIIRPDFAPRPEVGSYDAQFKSQLSPYIQQLNAASGFKECRKARQLIERLENEIMEMAQLAYNKPYAEFAKRGLANGFRRAMVLYLANGEKWEKAIEDFIVWSVKYDLWCKMRFFGNQMQEAIDADSRSVCHTPGVSNLLLYVHDTFDKTEIQNICQVHGTKTKLAILLCNWKKRGFIMKNEDGTFTKTARFIAKYGHYGTPGVAA